MNILKHDGHKVLKGKNKSLGAPHLHSLAPPARAGVRAVQVLFPLCLTGFAL